MTIYVARNRRKKGLKMLSVISVFAGGGIGSVLRYLVSSRIGSHWGIMTVNLLGALIIGIVYHFVSVRTGLRPEVKAFLMTGMLGGFTTFSTYMLDFCLLMGRQQTAEAFLYLLGSLMLGVAFLYLGIYAGKILF